MTVPPGADPQITYKFTDIFRNRLIAELPITTVTFSKVLNGVGPWAGTLNVNDRGVQRSNWITATAPWLSSFWIDINGVLIYGGPVINRQYTRSTGLVSLSGFDFAGYLGQRGQAQDYSNYTDSEGHAWAITGAAALRIAFYILKQALTVDQSIPIKVVTQGATPESLWITLSAPLTQSQTLASLLTQCQELGYLVGIDYACDVAYVGGVPAAQITLSYPRREASTKPVIDLDNVLDLQWPEDGSQQANRIVEQAGATSDRTGGKEWPPAREAGYPLLETTISHPALAPTASGNAAILEACAQGDITTRAFALTVPSVLMPMFGSPSILTLPLGGDVRVRSLPHAGDQPPTDPRFPNGLDVVQRIIRIDGSVPDEGVPLMVVYLNPPPSTTPVEPAVTTGSGPAPEPEKAKVEEEERTEKEAVEAVEAAKKEAEESREAAEKGKGEIPGRGPEFELAKERAEKAEKEAKEAKEAAEGGHPGEAKEKAEKSKEGSGASKKETREAEERDKAEKEKEAKLVWTGTMIVDAFQPVPAETDVRRTLSFSVAYPAIEAKGVEIEAGWGPKEKEGVPATAKSVVFRLAVFTTEGKRTSAPTLSSSGLTVNVGLSVFEKHTAVNATWEVKAYS